MDRHRSSKCGFGGARESGDSASKVELEPSAEALVLFYLGFNVCLSIFDGVPF